MEKKKKNIFSAIRKAGAVGGAVIRAAVTIARVIEQIVDGIKEIFTGHRGDGNGDDADNGGNGGNQRGGSPLVGGKLGLLLAAAAGFGAGWLCSGVSDGVTMAFAIVAGVAGKGNHVTGEPLTTDLADQASPGLLRNEIDDRIVKIRPMSTPLDQISRYGGSRLCGSMKVDYYSVDTRPMQSQLTAAFTAERNVTVPVASLQVKQPGIFDPTTTLLVPSVKASDGGSLVLYVLDHDTDTVRVMAVNNRTASGELSVPSIASGATLVRMGRAAAELDVMTAQFEALPRKETNYCQIFKTQVEQSTFMKIANKEVGWSFSDQEEAAIIDMRMGMERSFLFGCKSIITDPNKQEDILLTGGIWNQTDNTFEYSSLTTEQQLVALCKAAFTNSAGSSRKVLIGGTGLIEQLHNIDHTRVITSERAVTKWGLDFTEIHSKFGTLYVLLSEVFDQCGMPDAGMVIDPEYITKYSHVPFRTERLDLRSAGVRNTDAIVITEASCLVLRFPNSHMRIVKK
jgi:hypothetical protein